MHITIHFLEKDAYWPRELQKHPSSAVKCLAVPRLYFSSYLWNQLQNIQNHSIYLLLGENDDNELMVYTWETTQLANRMGQHMKERDWIENILLFELRQNYGVSMLHYIESNLIKTIRDIGRRKDDNKNTGFTTVLEPQDIDAAEEIIDEIKVLLEVAGYDMMKPLVWKNKIQEIGIQGLGTAIEGIRELKISGGKATGLYDGKKITVLAWSIAKKEWWQATSPTTINSKKRTDILRNRLLLDWVLEEFWSDSLIFTKDYEFTTLTQAASIILWYHCSWPLVWWIRSE